jgi:hypothetical protein
MTDSNPPTIEFTPGTSLLIEVRFTQEDGTPIYLDDAIIRMKVRDRVQDPNNIFIDIDKAGGGIEVLGEEKDSIRIVLSEEQTMSIPTSSFLEVRIKFPDNSSIFYPPNDPALLKRKPRISV